MRTGDEIRVLHVDDDPGFTDLTATSLEREDDRIEVETAMAAADGLELLSEERFDCIVSDYEMPGKDGIEFLEEVREDRPDLPFILFTGEGSEALASEAISAGVTDYLRKAGGERYALLANRIDTAVEGYLARKEAEWQRTVIENMGEGVYVIDGSYTFRYVKFRVPDIEGTSEGDWVGQPVSYLSEIGILTPEEVGRIRDGVDRILDGEADDIRIEMEPAIPEDTERLSYRLTSVRSPGDDDLALGTTRDITDR